MVFDYSGIYESSQQLRTVPVTPRDIIGMALTLFVPFIPIPFIHFSVGELLQKIAGCLRSCLLYKIDYRDFYID
jgi:hypothetical protein